MLQLVAVVLVTVWFWRNFTVKLQQNVGKLLLEKKKKTWSETSSS